MPVFHTGGKSIARGSGPANARASPRSLLFAAGLQFHRRTPSAGTARNRGFRSDCESSRITRSQELEIANRHSGLELLRV